MFVAIAVAVAAVTTWLSLRAQSPQSNLDEPPSNIVLPKFGKTPRLSISYPALGSTAALTISNFEITRRVPRDERDAFDTITKYEGNSSLVLKSFDHTADTGSVAGRFDLSRMQMFDAMINTRDPGSIESMVVRFRSRTSAAAFEYPVRLAGSGWLPIQMMRTEFLPIGGAVRSTWADIGVVEIAMISRPGSDARVNVDLLRAEADPAQRYGGAWSVADGRTLGLIRGSSGTALLLRNAYGTVGTLKEVADTKDFSLTAKLSPLTAGRAGLFFRGKTSTGNGFSFVIDGVGGHRWQLLRTDTGGANVLREGTIQISSFVVEEAYWLRAVVKGDRVDVSLSVDGTNFVKVATVKDGTTDFGQVGLAVYDGAAYAIYEIDYRRQ